MNRRFQKNTEDFVCERCHTSVVGDGYTNHCPECLWSKHVDIFPGDRAALCGALMEPVSKELKEGKWVLTHRCVSCGHEKRNVCSPGDSVDALIAIGV